MEFKITNPEDLQKALGQISVDHETKLQEVRGGMAEIKALVEDTGKRVDDVARLYNEGKADVLPRFDFGPDQAKTLAWETVFKRPTTVRMKAGTSLPEYDAADRDDLVAQVQQKWNEVYLVAAGMKMLDATGRPIWDQVRGLKIYRTQYLPLKERLHAALEKDGFHVGAGGASGTAGSGTEWAPDEFSNRLWVMAELPHQLSGIIPSFVMPRSDFMFPVELGHLSAYLTPEQTAGPGATAISDGKGSTSITGSKLFTSKKLATMVWISKEAEEDSIVALLPYLQGKTVRAIIRGRDNAIINGDTTATHMDFDVTSSTDVRKAWKGLRYYALNVSVAGTLDASGAYIDDDGSWRTNFRGARKKLGDAYKGNNADLVAVVSGNCAIDIGSVDAFRTAYAMGAGATNQNGDSTGFKPDGLGAFVVSEFARSDVAATGVNVNGGTNTYTTVIQFYREAWLQGVQRSVRLEVLKERYAEFDQDAVKVTWRGDMQYMLTGNHTVATIGVPGS